MVEWRYSSKYSCFGHQKE